MIGESTRMRRPMSTSGQLQTRRSNVCEFPAAIKPQRNIRAVARSPFRMLSRIQKSASRKCDRPWPAHARRHAGNSRKRACRCSIAGNRRRYAMRNSGRIDCHVRWTCDGSPWRIDIFNAAGSNPQKKPRLPPGLSSLRKVISEYQNVILQLSIRPVSAFELSVTRSLQVPFNRSLERLTM